MRLQEKGLFPRLKNVRPCELTESQKEIIAKCVSEQLIHMKLQLIYAKCMALNLSFYYSLTH